MKRFILLIGMVALLSACASNRTATVTWSDNGLEVTMVAPKGSVVKAEQDGKKAEFDDRGKQGIIESVIELWTVKTLSD